MLKIKTLYKTKFPAATLQETIVALTIVMICFSIALMVFVNVMKTENTRDQLKAHLILKEISQNTILEKSYYNDGFEKGNFSIEKQISNHPSIQSLGLLEIRVYKNSRLLIESIELFVKYGDYE